MKNLTFIRVTLLVVVATFINSSCTEKIDLKLKDSAPQIVIEGNMSDKPGPYYVIVTKSRLFTEDNSFTGLSSALVVISDDAGNSETLTEALAGLYQTNFIQGTIGRTYRLSVTVEGTTYESLCKMQTPVDIDSIIQSTETEFNGDVKKQAEVLVRDPVGVPNFYRVISYLNGDMSSGFDEYRDRLWDGKLRTFNVPHSDFQSGDTLTVDLLSLDEHVHDYFDQFNQNQNNFGSSASPANPDPVFTPKALGYFSAHSIKSKTVVIP